MRHKHSQEINVIHEQLDVVKKNKMALEKIKSTLEAENADMASEIKTLTASRTEGERKRKQLESQFSELQSRLAEAERGRGEGSERLVRLQAEIDSLSVQLVEAESKLTVALKSQTSIEQQLAEVQALLEEETRQKLALSSRLRQVLILFHHFIPFLSLCLLVSSF